VLWLSTSTGFTSVLRAESEICERCSGYLRTSCFSAISIDNQTAVFHFDSQGSVSELDNSLLQAQNVMMPIVHSPCLNSLTASLGQVEFGASSTKVNQGQFLVLV
jgi:hypothetical protein